MSSRTFTTEDKLACAEREIRQRRRVYPRLVLTGRMTDAEADVQIALMEAIAADYLLRLGNENPDLFTPGAPTC